MAELGAVLFFSILGYLALQSCHFSRYRWHALEATLVGAVLFVACRLVVPWLESAAPTLAIRDWIKARVLFPQVGTFTLALVIGYALSGIVNWIIGRERAVRAAVRNYGGEVYSVIRTSMKT